MTVPVDITDPRLVRAYAHPLRMHILGLLDGRVASPTEIAVELGTPLGRTSYHVRKLVALGLVELVGRSARRGAIEHHYTAKVRPTITDEGWAKLSDIVKRAIVESWLQQTIAHVVTGAEAGGFHRDDAHHSRTAGPLDDEGWTRVARVLARALSEVEEAYEDARVRLDEDAGANVNAVDATTVLMHLVGPPPRSIARGGPSEDALGAGQRARQYDLQLDDPKRLQQAGRRAAQQR